MRNNYSALSQSITEPVRVAKLLHEDVISDEALSCVTSTRGSVCDSRAVLLKAVRDAVHSNYKHLELFVTVLKKFSETTHIGDTIFEDYSKCNHILNTFLIFILEQCFPNGNSSKEEIECLLSKERESSVVASTAAIAKGLYLFLLLNIFYVMMLGQTQIGHRILIPRKMSPEFTLIRTEFGAMFYNIRTIITSKEIDSNELKKLIGDCFSDLKPQLENKVKIDDVLEVVKGKCSLIDVHCLEVIVRTFKITGGQELLDSYKEAVNKFCKSMSSRLCVDEILQVVRTPTRLASETVVFIVDWNPDTSTLEDIKNLLSISLDTNFQIEKIGTGQSVVITCYCPAEYTTLLIMAVLSKIKILQEKGLKEFKVGNCTVWNNTAHEV